MPSGPNVRPSFSLEVDEVSETLRRYVEGSNASFEATSDQLVRVRVGSSMNVLEVEFLDPTMDARTKEALQIAALGAVNAALQKAALAAGQAFAELEQTVRIRSRRTHATGKPGKDDDSDAID